MSATSLSDNARPEIRAWLNTFAACVRACAFDSARAMFADDVISFGTWTGRMTALETLVDAQWKNVWPKTADFRFDLDTAAIGDSWAAVTWTSHALPVGDRPGFARSGRATFVFRFEDGHALAVHSHLSLNPVAGL